MSYLLRVAKLKPVLLLGVGGGIMWYMTYKYTRQTSQYMFARNASDGPYSSTIGYAGAVAGAGTFYVLHRLTRFVHPLDAFHAPNDGSLLKRTSSFLMNLGTRQYKNLFIIYFGTATCAGLGFGLAQAAYAPRMKLSDHATDPLKVVKDAGKK